MWQKIGQNLTAVFMPVLTVLFSVALAFVNKEFLPWCPGTQFTKYLKLYILRLSKD